MFIASVQLIWGFEKLCLLAVMLALNRWWKTLTVPTQQKGKIHQFPTTKSTGWNVPDFVFTNWCVHSAGHPSHNKYNKQKHSFMLHSLFIKPEKVRQTHLCYCHVHSSPKRIICINNKILLVKTMFLPRWGTLYYPLTHGNLYSFP